MASIGNGLSDTQRLVAVGIIGFIIGVILTAAWFGFVQPGPQGTERATEPNGEVAEDEAATPNSTQEQATVTGNDRIAVDNQATGSRVQLTAIELRGSTWVAIHEDINGAPGNVLGAARFSENEGSGIVELLRGTETGLLYYARLYRDNGDGEFSLTDDALVVSDDEQPIEDTFRTTR